jgi:CRP-like cAMP-binding protein
MKVDAKDHGEDHEHDHDPEDVRRLRGFPAFAKFSDDELERLVRAGKHTSQTKPWPLMREQTPSEDCFILLSGEVGVYVGADRVAILGPGELIGESAIRQGKLRSATVTTIGAAEVLWIERDALARLLDEIPALRETMDGAIAKHAADLDASVKPHRALAALNLPLPADLVERFENAAATAGVGITAALEDALTQWIKRKGG